MLDKLTAQDFRAQVNERFVVSTPGGEEAPPLWLAEVTEYGVDENAPRCEPFSLIFRATERVYLPQQVYRLTNKQMGELELFLVPLQPDAQGIRMQAIFN